MSNLLLCRHHPAEIGDTNDYSLYENQYLTTEALGSGTITFTIPVDTSRVTDVSYRKNEGEWTTTTNSSSTVVITVNVVTGDIVEWKGNAIRYGGGGAFADCSHWGGTASFNVYGNLMSMLWNDNFIGKTEYPSAQIRATQHMFSETLVADASNLILPATISAGTHTYMCLFQNCTSLVLPPANLPLTVLPEAVYYGMFSGCTSLTTMPNILSEETSSTGRYPMHRMFDGCTALEYNLDQTIYLGEARYQCCQYMFRNCTSMRSSPKFVVSGGLAADYAFSGMFEGCTHLCIPPERFDVDTVEYGMFYNTFKNCPALEYSPIVNIRNVGNNTYYAFASMFYGCSSLQDASGLNIYFPDDSEWNGEDTFDTMCYNCNNMVNSPTLNINGTVITKSRRTFYDVFYQCYDMETHDIELNYVIDSNASITTGASYGSATMFYKCTSMIDGPRLIRLSLRDNEYNRAFDGCTALKKLWVKFNSNPSANALTSWLVNVSSSGTIYQAGTLSLPTGTSGRPSGWTLNTTDWTAQRHARMTMSFGWYSGTLTNNIINNIISNPANYNIPTFDYYGDTIEIDDILYYIWENSDDINSNYGRVLTTTDNFYELKQASLYWGGWNTSQPHLGKTYEWLEGMLSPIDEISYDREEFEIGSVCGEYWYMFNVWRNQG